MDANLNLVAAKYRTSTTEFVYANNILETVLEANPNRWFVQFLNGQGASGKTVLPKGQPYEVADNLYDHLPLEYKFRDCPSIVTGEFVGIGMPGESIIIIECIYLGG